MSRNDIRDALAGIGIATLIVLLLRPGGPGQAGVVAAGEALMGAIA